MSTWSELYDALESDGFYACIDSEGGWSEAVSKWANMKPGAFRNGWGRALGIGAH